MCALTTSSHFVTAILSLRSWLENCCKYIWNKKKTFTIVFHWGLDKRIYFVHILLLVLSLWLLIILSFITHFTCAFIVIIDYFIIYYTTFYVCFHCDYWLLNIFILWIVEKCIYVNSLHLHVCGMVKFF